MEALNFAPLGCGSAAHYAGPALDASSCGRRKPRPPWWGMVVRADTDSVGFHGELTLGLNIARGR